jgi:hypothetical protein
VFSQYKVYFVNLCIIFLFFLCQLIATYLG